MARKLNKVVKEIENTKNDIDRLRNELEEKENSLKVLLSEKENIESNELLELIKSKMSLEEAKELIMSR